ncbi:MAG: hypothetical protein IJ012_06835 [Clostridia bacterium]|nr:hypothetical protein [Clostridia bacterium]
MKTYHYNESPLKIFGLAFYEKNGRLERLPAETREAVPTLAELGLHTAGVRIGFRTNSPTLTVKLTLGTISVDLGMSLYSAQSLNVMIGDRPNAYYAGFVGPSSYTEKEAEKTFRKSAEMEEVTVWLPRNEVVADVSVTVEDDALVAPPTPYTYPPMLYYGSSITEGACASRVTNAYNAIISRHLDVDYYNFGFSGRARGEMPMADLIADIPLSVFVLDYDHNAPSVDHLRETHEPFFKRIREKNPDLPILMLTKPDYDYDARADERRAIIRATYENAVAAGDKNVYFIDGQSYFGDTDRELCTVDRVHPNDVGHFRMAAVIEPLIAKILRERYGK